MVFLCGLFSGFVVGILVAAWIDTRNNKEAIEIGMIKLNGKIYSIQEMNL